MTGIAFGWADATAGHAIAVPISMMASRRLIQLPRRLVEQARAEW
jgi:hypothetical protein